MPEKLIPTSTITPIEERCQNTVTIGSVEMRCGRVALHEGLHLANLMGRGGVVAVLSWTLEDF